MKGWLRTAAELLLIIAAIVLWETFGPGKARLGRDGLPVYWWQRRKRR